jgi:hypothetical protein
MNSKKHTALVVSVLAFAGCSDATAPTGDQSLQVNVHVVGGGSAASAYLSTIPHADAATTVDIDSAYFVLGGLKLETAGIDNTVDWVFDESVVIPLNLGGTPVLAFDTDVPNGTYK